MSTKYFTLSAVCALAFGMLLALSGTTDLAPGYQAAKATPVNPDGAAYLPPDGSGPLAKAQSHVATPMQKSTAGTLSDWGGQVQSEDTDSLLGILKQISGNVKLRLVGIMFIVGWVLLSVKMLSSG